MSDDKSCADWQTLLGAHADGELAPAEAMAVAEHLSRCVDCANEFSDLLLTMKTLHEALPSMQAPDVLRARIQSDLARAKFNPVRRQNLLTDRSARRWLIAASLVFVTTGAVVTWGRIAPARASAMEDGVLTAHVRSLQAGHLTDVASTDQHTVKPWFTGKLDFSPAVPRLESDSFPLVGGRMDYVGNHAVAALVYRRRSHVINVLISPSTVADDRAPHLDSKHGFQIANWASGGMSYWVISDLNSDELRTFCGLFREQAAMP